ncbi:MAG: hypothetical protein R3300_20425, partial [Candidatus Promineifilaceae bacterium]|nr:hypothetical protein [Candidatus Promineifilaceae bacterium]
ETATDGVIVSNTTTARPGLVDPNRDQAGGLSGLPLQETSTELIGYVARAGLPVIGVGGIFGVADVRRKLDAGASLVQLYTGLVYEGPSLPGRILRALG